MQPNENALIYPTGTDTKALRLFAYNQDVIRSYLPSYRRVNSEKLFKSLTAYLIYNYDAKCDMFGYTELDLREICNEYLGTPISNLNSKLNVEETFSYQELRMKLEDKGLKGKDLDEKINQEINKVKGMEDSDVIFFDSLIDDFLNRLLSKKIKYNMVLKNKDKIITENQAHSFLDALKIVKDRHQKNKKRYLIKLSDFYIKSLNRSFVFQQSKVIKKLLKESKGNTRTYDLYYFLTSIKEKCRAEKLNAYKIPFESLVSQLNLYDIKSPASQKNKINKYLSEVKSKCDHLEFDYKWIKNSHQSRYKYALYVVFELRGYNNLNLFKVKLNDFRNLTKLYYYNLYLSLTGLPFLETEEERHTFNNWAKDPYKHKEDKIKWFSQAFYEIYSLPLVGYFKESLYHNTIELSSNMLKDLKEYSAKK